jgi:diguanylate cyclase (GGDEF)-like protein
MQNQNRNSIFKLLESVFSLGDTRRRFHVSSEEDKAIKAALVIKQRNRATFIALCLIFLAVAFFIMLFVFHVIGNSILVLIGITNLLVSSFLYLLFGITDFYLKKNNPLVCRLVTDFYYLLILLTMGLLFYVTCAMAAINTAFSPVFLYLLFFTVICSPYFLDSAVIMLIGGSTIFVTYCSMVGVYGFTFCQYVLIYILFFASMVYFYVGNYQSELQEIRANQAYGQLSYLSKFDRLTGIQNRYSLEEQLRKSWDQWTSSETAVSLVFFDVDSFKLYNDTFSHISGDKCLASIASKIQGLNLFSPQCFYRYGGDEFLIVLTGVDQDRLAVIGNAVVQAVHDSKIPAPSSARHPYVSVSVGAYCGILQKGKTFDDCLKLADQELYLAKNNGGDVFCFQGKLLS